ncbi:17103_t:CDS:2 [Entrophospora sp. SA101]|nr:17103_t:CDS:2 [Entrophospora sp. SA101]CAJ0856534.1 8549_t:CDS:2 [Entrophospora sp. SA101]CAJ0914147.1 15807_t:CDS:2 [Entrophospora sp. SA101]
MKTIYNFNSFLISTLPIHTTISSKTATKTKKFDCSQQTRHLSINLFYLLLANIIIQILYLPGVDSEFVKREGPYTCPYSGNDVLYCKPGQNEFFKVNDSVIVAWNKNFVIYAGSKTLNVNLFRRDISNSAMSVTVPGFPVSVKTDEGSISFKASLDWILPEIPPPTFLISSSYDFTVQYYKPSNIINISSATVITTTAIVTETNSIIGSDDHEHKMHSPVIISVIVVSIVAALLAFIVIVLFTIIRKRNNKTGKEQNFSTLSTSSNTLMVESTLSGNSDVSDGFHKDAALISDAFRKVLRKPNWKHGDNDIDEEDFDANLSEEDLARRREAKELMKKELAEEGTGIHSVSRRQTTIEHSSIREWKDDSDNVDNIEGRKSSSSDVGGMISGDSRIININPDNNKL